MAIRSGIGVGEAQVYEIGDVINNFSKLLQKQQQEEAKFQAEIADIIANVDTKGVREADKLEIANMYDATKQLYRQASQAKNFQEKALLKSKIAKAVNDINEYAQNSAGWVKKYDSLARDVASNPWAYEPTVVEKLRGLKDVPLSKMGADIVLDPFEYQKVPSDKSRDNVFSAIRRQGETFAKSTFAAAGAGREREVKILPDSKIQEYILTNLSVDPQYKATALMNWSQSNPGKPLDINQVVANEVALYKSQYGNQYVGNATRIPKEKTEREGEDKLTYRQQLISGLINKDQQALGDFTAVLPANTKVKYVPSVKIPGKSQGGYPMIRVTIPETSSPTGMEIVETIPLGSGNTVQRLNSILNQYSGEKISPSSIAIKGGKRTGERFQVNKPTQTKQLEIKESDIASKAQAAGYTVNEYKKLLQQRGVKIVK